MAEAYCVRCKKKKEMKNGREVSMKGKGGTERRMLKGECSVCGTKMCQFLPKKK